MADRDNTAARRLRQIADMLGVPVERLFDGATHTEQAHTEECLRLWLRLRTDAGRTAALNYLRKALDEEAV